MKAWNTWLAIFLRLAEQLHSPQRGVWTRCIIHAEEITSKPSASSLCVQPITAWARWRFKLKTPRMRYLLMVMDIFRWGMSLNYPQWEDSLNHITDCTEPYHRLYWTISLTVWTISQTVLNHVTDSLNHITDCTEPYHLQSEPYHRLYWTISLTVWTLSQTVLNHITDSLNHITGCTEPYHRLYWTISLTVWTLSQTVLNHITYSLNLITDSLNHITDCTEPYHRLYSDTTLQDWVWRLRKQFQNNASSSKLIDSCYQQSKSRTLTNVVWCATSILTPALRACVF